MTVLADILDPDRLALAVRNGWVKEVRHPSEPLRLYNYTAACQYERMWTPETRAARGLIVDDLNNVVARPFPKFFNLDEHGDDTPVGPVKLATPVTVMDKLDGSMCTGFHRPSDGGLSWATRGSFTSDQANWANQWWNRFHSDVDLPADFTWLAEVIHPANRIVVDYGTREELVLLAAIDTATGVDHTDWVAPVWPGSKAHVYGHTKDPASLDPSGQDEGFVLLAADRLTRVKVKSENYVRLHRIMFGVTARTIWEALSEGSGVAEILSVVPEEAERWVKETADRLQQAFTAKQREVVVEFNRIRHLLADRKEFAEVAKQSPNRALLFRLADNKPVSPLIWRDLKPAPEPMTVSTAGWSAEAA